MIQWQLHNSSGVVIDLFAYFADSSLNTILLICFLTEKYPDFFFRLKKTAWSRLANTPPRRRRSCPSSSRSSTIFTTKTFSRRTPSWIGQSSEFSLNSSQPKRLPTKYKPRKDKYGTTKFQYQSCPYRGTW